MYITISVINDSEVFFSSVIFLAIDWTRISVLDGGNSFPVLIALRVCSGYRHTTFCLVLVRQVRQSEPIKRHVTVMASVWRQTRLLKSGSCRCEENPLTWLLTQSGSNYTCDTFERIMSYLRKILHNSLSVFTVGSLKLHRTHQQQRLFPHLLLYAQAYTFSFRLSFVLFSFFSILLFCIYLYIFVLIRFF